MAQECARAPVQIPAGRRGWPPPGLHLASTWPPPGFYPLQGAPSVTVGCVAGGKGAGAVINPGCAEDVGGMSCR